jgi:hypothetical protein
MGHLRVHSTPACVEGRLRRLAVGFLTALWSLAALAAQAEPPSFPEYAIKAAYVYQFSSFIEWPPEAVPDPATPFCICVLGEDPFGPLLDALQHKTVQGRAVAIKRVKQIQESGGCQTLFVSASEAPRLDKILTALGTHPILTVADLPGFAQAGGAIEFIHQGNNIRFAINLDTARRAGLKISSKLLSLATVVRQSPGTAER